MTNGEWIVYGAECQKANPRIRDIFVGFGSDGKWYYTTFHFCVGMLDLEMESQSEDLASFITKYCLVEFDGKCDEALKKTWPALYVGNPAESSRTTFPRREEVNGDDSAMLVVAVGVRVAIIAWLVYCIVRRVRLARREKAELRERIEGAIASIKADGKVEGPKGAYVPHHAWKAGTPHDTVPPKARSYDGGEWPD